MRKRLISVLVMGSVLLSCSSAVSSSTLIFHEDFHSLEEWTEVYNSQFYDPGLPCRDESGNTVWKQTNFGFGAEIRDSVPCFMVLAGPTPETPSEIRELHWKWYFTDPHQDRNFLLHWQSYHDWLGLHIFGKTLYLEGKKDGKTISTAPPSAQYPFRADTQHDWRVRENLATGEIQIWVNQVLLIDTTVPEISEIQFRPSLAASVGYGVRSSQSYFQDLSIWSAPTAAQTVSWKQGDSRWGQQEYDSAATWSSEASSIGRWGCALTSAAMILDSAGVKQLPSGEQLNPGTLNTWLKTESDGYVGPGLLNWRAISKLALWHSQQYGTTKLEFSVARPEDKTEWLRNQLSKRFPIVLEQPEHFVVATDWSDMNTSASIHDPGYDRPSLQAYSNTFLSARVFTPSATNLQGATLVTPSWARLTATTALGDPVALTPLESTPYSLNDNSPETEWQMWDAPPWGLGPLILHSHAAIAIPLLGSWYSEDGIQSSVPVILTPNTPTQIDSAAPTIQILDQDFARLMSWQEIKTPAIWIWRQRLQDSGESEDVRHYRWLLENAKEHSWITPSAHALLEAELASRFPP